MSKFSRSAVQHVPIVNNIVSLEICYEGRSFTTKTKNKTKWRDTKEFLIVVIVSRLFAFEQTHQIVHINYVQVFVYQLYLNKVNKK